MARISYNPISAFRELLPGNPRRVGTVISTDQHTSVVSLFDGARLQVVGSALPGSMVYVTAGAIEGPAPNLPVEVIEID